MDIRYTSLFRLKRYEEAVCLLKKLVSQKIYCPTRRGNWYDELVRILDRYIDKTEAIAFCDEALSDPFVMPSHKVSIEKRKPRLTKRKSSPDSKLSLKESSVHCTTISAKRVDNIGNRVNYVLDREIKQHPLH